MATSAMWPPRSSLARVEANQRPRGGTQLHPVQAPWHTLARLDGAAVSRTAVMGITFGVVLVAFWLRRQGRLCIVGLLLLAIGYMVIFQLLRTAATP